MTGRPYAHCVYFIRSSKTKVCKQRKNVCVTELIYVRLHEDGMSGNANMTFNFIQIVLLFCVCLSVTVCVQFYPIHPLRVSPTIVILVYPIVSTWHNACLWFVEVRCNMSCLYFVGKSDTSRWHVKGHVKVYIDCLVEHDIDFWRDGLRLCWET